MLGWYWTAGGEMLSPFDTFYGSGCVDLDHQAPVVFDRKCVGGVNDRCRAGLFDGGWILELVARSQRVPLVDAVFQVVARYHRVDLARLEGWRAGGAALDASQTGRFEGEDHGDAQVQELHVDFSRRVAVGALVGLVEAGAELLPVAEAFQRDGDRVLLAEVAEVDGAMEHRRADAGQDRRDLAPHLLVAGLGPAGVGLVERGQYGADQ